MITPGVVLSIESTGYFRVLMVDCSQDVDYKCNYAGAVLSELIHNIDEGLLLECAVFLPNCHGN